MKVKVKSLLLLLGLILLIGNQHALNKLIGVLMNMLVFKILIRIKEFMD
jgi:hypothetical protein